jgi:hypothetical protein
VDAMLGALGRHRAQGYGHTLKANV